MVDRKMRVTWCFLVTAILILGLTLGMTCKKKNQPPGAPSIPSGPTSGRKGDTLRFLTRAEDPDGDRVSVRFDWGDSTMSGWSEWVASGESVVTMHTWQRLGAYSIRAQAGDAGETASAWSAEHRLTVASFSEVLGGSEGTSVQQTTDGGYIVTGWTSCPDMPNDVWLVKTDESGAKTWDKVFGGAHNDEGNSVQQTSDGGYIVAGSTWSIGAGDQDAWLIRTDALGNRLWDKTFGKAGYDAATSVQQTMGGGYVFTGVTSGNGPGDGGIWLVKTDASGNLLWDRNLGAGSEFHAHSVLQTQDGGYIVAGDVIPFGGHYSDAWLIKTDTSGNKLWDRTFGESRDDIAFSARQTSDGGYVMAGFTEPIGNGTREAWLIKTDEAGNKTWDRTFGGSGDDEGFSVQQTSDGGYIIAGFTTSFGMGWADMLLIKTDASGNRIWDKVRGEAEVDEVAEAVQQTLDGGYVMTGYIYSNSAAWGAILLIKTDAEGN